MKRGQRKRPSGLENEAVTGEVLIGVTAQELWGSGMKLGPATLLVKQLQATGRSAPPTAASGLQAGAFSRAGSRNLAGSPPR